MIPQMLEAAAQYFILKSNYEDKHFIKDVWLKMAKRLREKKGKNVKEIIAYLESFHLPETVWDQINDLMAEECEHIRHRIKMNAV